MICTYIYIHLFILHGYITNSQYDQLPVGLIAQLVEHCTGIAFFRLSFRNCLSCVVTARIFLLFDLSSAVQIYVSYIYIQKRVYQKNKQFIVFFCLERKVKRTAFISPIDKGDLKMPNIESMISAQRIICIKRYLSTNPASWMLFFDFYLRKEGGKFSFHCNLNYTKLPISLQEFYKECICSMNPFFPHSLK